MPDPARPDRNGTAFRSAAARPAARRHTRFARLRAGAHGRRRWWLNSGPGSAACAGALPSRLGAASRLAVVRPPRARRIGGQGCAIAGSDGGGAAALAVTVAALVAAAATTATATDSAAVGGTALGSGTGGEGLLNIDADGCGWWCERSAGSAAGFCMALNAYGRVVPACFVEVAARDPY